MKRGKVVLSFLLFFVLFLAGCKTMQKQSTTSSDFFVEKGMDGHTTKGNLLERRNLTKLSFPFDQNEKGEFFFLTLRLPSDWSLKEKKSINLYLPIFSVYEFLNEKEETIGMIGFRHFEEGNEPDEKRMGLFYERVLIFPDKKIETENSYQVVNATYNGSTTIVEVPYSNSRDEKKHKINRGILAYDRSLSVFVFLEFEADKVEEELFKEIAKSIMFE